MFCRCIFHCYKLHTSFRALKKKLLVISYYKWKRFIWVAELHEGTASPDATCAATHYGLASPKHGGVSAPSHHHIFWNIEEQLQCTHRFIPAANQSVTIEVSSKNGLIAAHVYPLLSSKYLHLFHFRHCFSAAITIS